MPYVLSMLSLSSVILVEISDATLLPSVLHPCVWVNSSLSLASSFPLMIASENIVVKGEITTCAAPASDMEGKIIW